MPTLTLEEKKKAESFGLGDFQFDEGELQGLREEPLLIATETAADDVRKSRDVQISLQGQTTTPAGDIKKETLKTPEISKEEPKEKPDNIAVDGTIGTPISFEEALEIYGNDFTGLHRTEKGEYIPDETALARTGIKGLETAKIDKSEEEFETAKSELKAVQEQLKRFDVSNDPALIRMKESITAQWDARIEEMRDINTRREKSFETLGFRTGARFTGGARGGIFGGILSEEERQGTMRIADFEAKKQSALIAAENAYRTQKWSEYSDLVDIAEDNYTKQLTELEKLQKEQAKQSQKIQDEGKLMSRDVAIAEIVSSGETNLETILLELQNRGITTTLNDVSDAFSKLSPEVKGLADIIKSAAQNGASSAILSAISKAKNLNDAYLIASDYLQTGAGIVGEYLFYKREAIANKQIPIDFDSFQTIDANRKAKATISGVPNNVVTQIDKISASFDTSPIVKQYNEVANKTETIYRIVNEGITGGASDLALVFEFMKSLDPTSVVRESEYDTASKAGNPFKRIAAKMGGYMENGEILPEEVRKEFSRLSQLKLDVITKQYENLRKEKGRLVEQKTKEYNDKTLGIDYLIDYAAATTQQNIIEQENEAQNTIFAYIEQNPDTKKLIRKMIEDEKSYIEIKELLNI